MEDFLERFLEWRGINSPCTKCQGVGSIAYASTATWRGGVGGAAITWDVCNLCWGSGDATKPWTNLQLMESKNEYRQDIFRALEFVIEQLDRFGEWDDGCYYYNKVSAPELQRPIEYAHKVIKSVKREK